MHVIIGYKRLWLEKAPVRDLSIANSTLQLPSVHEENSPNVLMLKVFRWHCIFLWFVCIYVWVTVFLYVICKCVAIVHNSESKKTQNQPGLEKPEHCVDIFTDERRMLMAYQRGWRIMPDKDMGNFKQHTCFEITQWWHELSFLGELFLTVIWDGL